MNTTPVSNELIRTALSHPAVILVNLLARTQGIEVFLVGGAVRDLLLTGQLPLDLDFTLTTPPDSEVSAESFSKMVAHRLDGHYVLLDAEFGIHRVVIQKDDSPDLTLDIADALDNDLHRDLSRRDLTINAMALDLDSKKFFDPCSGIDDLNQGILRMVSETNLADDPLRMLRVFRFMAQLAPFRTQHIEFSTFKGIKSHRDKILNSAAERIHYEFLRMLSYPQSFPALKQMAESGLLEVILPELVTTRTIPPNGHHHLMLFDHTLELVNQAERLLLEFPKQAKNDLDQPVTPFCTRAGAVKLACLLHDIGKPATMAIRDDGRHTFYGHDKVSEEMTAVIGRRWKLSRSIIGRTQKLVRWHLYPCQFGTESPRKSILRFFRRMNDETPDVILLALADRHSTLGPEITHDILQKSTTDHLWLLAQFYEESAVLKLPPLLDGREVMALLKWKPGPKIGKAIEALKEVHQLGEVTTADEAKHWLLENFKAKS